MKTTVSNRECEATRHNLRRMRLDIKALRVFDTIRLSNGGNNPVTVEARNHYVAKLFQRLVKCDGVFYEIEDGNIVPVN